MLQGYEWLIVAAVVLLLFGGTQIPKLARSLGEARQEFQRGSGRSDDDDESPGN